MHRSAAQLALVALLAGCVGAEPAAEARPTCDEAVAALLVLNEETRVTFAGPCDVDADCRIDRISGTCAGGDRYGFPDEALAIARSVEATAYVQERERSFCPVATVEGCPFPSFDNFYRYAWCDDGTCRGTQGDPEVVCPGIAESVVVIAAELSDALPDACATVADCVVVTPTFSCPEHELFVTGCDVVLAADQSIEAALADALVGLCVERGFSCAVAATCGTIEPRCEQGRCIGFLSDEE